MQYKRSYFEETLMTRDYAFDINDHNYYKYMYHVDRLCGLVVRVLFYRSGGLGSIPGTTRKK
jgi:hypothetical protein